MKSKSASRFYSTWMRSRQGAPSAQLAQRLARPSRAQKTGYLPRASGRRTTPRPAPAVVRGEGLHLGRVGEGDQPHAHRSGRVSRKRPRRSGRGEAVGLDVRGHHGDGGVHHHHHGRLVLAHGDHGLGPGQADQQGPQGHQVQHGGGVARQPGLRGARLGSRARLVKRSATRPRRRLHQQVEQEGQGSSRSVHSRAGSAKVSGAGRKAAPGPGGPAGSWREALAWGSQLTPYRGGVSRVLRRR